MKAEYIEIAGALILFVGAAALLNAINKRRKNKLLRRLYAYSNVPRFIENQLNSTHKR